MEWKPAELWVEAVILSALAAQWIWITSLGKNKIKISAARKVVLSKAIPVPQEFLEEDCFTESRLQKSCESKASQSMSKSNSIKIDYRKKIKKVNLWTRVEMVGLFGCLANAREN